MTDELNEAEQQLAAMDVASTEEFSPLLQAHARARDLASKADRIKDDLAKKIIQLMDAQGLTSIKAGGRRAGFTKRTNYGIAEGATPAERAANIAAVKSWLEEIAPDVNIPASTNIAKAVALYLDTNPGAPLPGFLAKNETRSLTNAVA